MMRAIWVFCLVSLAVAGGVFQPAEAAYPDKPVQLIMPYAAGGSTDLLARAMAQFAPKYFLRSTAPGLRPPSISLGD